MSEKPGLEGADTYASEAAGFIKAAMVFRKEGEDKSFDLAMSIQFAQVYATLAVAAATREVTQPKEEDVRVTSIATVEIPGHHPGSPLYERVYGLLALNNHKISYQMDDLADNAGTVREWLDEEVTTNPADDES